MTSADNQLSVVLVSLMRGVKYRHEDPALWQSIIALQARVYDYVSLLGLELILDEGEGYAYLRQRPMPQATAEPSVTLELPRLVPRRPLGFPVSLLLALLRKKLAESDVKSGDTRLIVSRDDIVDLIRLFMPDASNEARLTDRMSIHIAKAVELGFLRPLQGRDDEYEVRRILKAFVDAQWLSALEERLVEYRAHASSRD